MMKQVQEKKRGKGGEVKHTPKARVSLAMPHELYERALEAAKRDNRNFSNWLVQAAMEKLTQGA